MLVSALPAAYCFGGWAGVVVGGVKGVRAGGTGWNGGGPPATGGIGTSRQAAGDCSAAPGTAVPAAAAAS